MNKIILTTVIYVLSISAGSAQLGLGLNDVNPDHYKTELMPVYTSAENLFNVEIGMNYNEVRRVLDVEPFGILNNMKGSGMIVEFKYMQKGKKVLQSKDTYYMDTFKQSNTHYHDAKSVYMVFDENKVLKSYYTDAGTKLSADVLTWENTLNIMLNDVEGHCANCEVNSQRETASDSSKKCDKKNSSSNEKLEINLNIKRKKKKNQ